MVRGRLSQPNRQYSKNERLKVTHGEPIKMKMKCHNTNRACVFIHSTALTMVEELPVKTLKADGVGLFCVAVNV